MNIDLLLTLLPPPKVEPTITVGACTLQALLSFQESYTIEIPDYQRPYVWSTEKVEELLKDLRSFYDEKENHGKYYMGSLLLHRKPEERYDIIDGQQRITTLLILDYVLNEKSSTLVTQSEYLNLLFNSPKSKENIIRNESFLRDKLSSYGLTDQKRLFDDLIITIIVTTSQDDAFTFFDTQNNRGVKLSAIDYLKSFHLRELKGHEDKQRVFAKKWDSNNQNQLLHVLFNHIIWRGRRWRGKTIIYENKEFILEEFQKKVIDKSEDGSVALYPNSKNKLAASLTFDTTNGISLQTYPIFLQATPVSYPFSLRQPIEKGTGFFLYAEKYTALYKHVFYVKNEASELYKAVKFYKSVYNNVSEYLRMLFEVCLVMYYDKFEENKIYEFSLWLDYLIGTYRINQKSIVAQTPIKILRDKDFNLLDVIDNSYRPEEIFSFLKGVTDEGIYINERVDSGNGVQATYKRQFNAYFKQSREESLRDKKKWIYERINSK
ncbi:DUF262 domain-containing protein [Pontibacter sp. Tf4]|uniref:DUF262 domain-containing protein n=1 Tax=Pontibacter sp. Tf4 TaxID=2761620 RepID=UPI00162926E1|nr:DUF262 domain-containing protein [Pontibacter sp. Tf4]